MYRGIKNLYLIKGKIVFRAHLRKNGQEKHVWKVVGKPEDFTEEELREIARELLRKALEESKETETKISHDSTSENRKACEKKPQTESKTQRYKPQVQSQKTLNSSITLGELSKKFLEWYKKQRRKSSYERHKYSAGNLLKFFGENTPVEEINLESVENYKSWRLSQGIKPTSINKELRFLATMINRAVEFEWIPKHKLYRRPILIKGVNDARLRYLTDEEEKRLFSVVKNPLLRDILIFALNTGLRRCEILSLKWKNVDFENRYLILEPEQTKNKKWHVLPLNSAAWKVIENRLKEKAENCEYVFHRNGKPIKSIRTAFESALKRAEIKDFRFHDLRHTFASRLVQKNIDLYVIKELLNHSDIQTTQRYAHLKLDNLKKAVYLLEK